MCLNIYIGSEKQLPVIEANERSPGFYITIEDNPSILEMAKPILSSKFIYTVGSHMGCTCGFNYGNWSLTDDSENHPQRVKDVHDFMTYLTEHKANHQLFVFGTWWNDFKEIYLPQAFNPKSVDELEFDFPEEKLLSIV